MNLADYLADAAGLVETESKGRRATQGTFLAARRARRLREAGTGALTMCIVAALAAFALWPGHGGDAAPATWPPDPMLPNPYADMPACGEGAPAVLSQAQGFDLRLVTNEPATLSNGHDASVVASGKLSTFRREAVPVVASPLGFVWVKDGAVVGFTDAGPAAAPTAPGYAGLLRWNMPFAVYGGITRGVYDCSSPDGGPWTPLGMGDYQVFPVMRVQAGPSVAALATSQPDLGDAAYADYLFSVAPVAEEERSTWDSDVDLTLVAAPLSVTLTGQWPSGRASEPDHDAAPPSCGDSPLLQPGDTNAKLTASAVAVSPDPSAASGREASLGLISARLVSPSKLTLPDTVSVALLGTASDDAPQGTVVGKAVFTPRSHHVTLDSNNQMATIEGSLSSVHWCEGRLPVSGAVASLTVTWRDVNGTTRVTASN